VTTKHLFQNKKFRLQIRERDHNPPHAHLVGGDYDVMIYLETLKSEGQWPKGIKKEVLSWVEENRTKLLEEWGRWHR